MAGAAERQKEARAPQYAEPEFGKCAAGERIAGDPIRRYRNLHNAPVGFGQHLQLGAKKREIALRPRRGLLRLQPDRPPLRQKPDGARVQPCVGPGSAIRDERLQCGGRGAAVQVVLLGIACLAAAPDRMQLEQPAGIGIAHLQDPAGRLGDGT